jgi:hypothetical protein
MPSRHALLRLAYAEADAVDKYFVSLWTGSDAGVE